MDTKTSTKKFQELQGINLPSLELEILEYWKQNQIFEKSVEYREGAPAFVFYDGPPSANGVPGIHHVISRTIKDIFCRYKTLKGYQVIRRAGWDTHGLPIELNVEKELGITKEDIGVKISVEDYNKACRTAVMRFTDEWKTVTDRMAYWVDMDNPYVTYDNSYIQTCWHLLSKLYEKGYLYKGYTIQPFSPAAGTGLSSHELNQPGTYKPVKDTTIVAQFKAIRDSKSEWLFDGAKGDVFFLAWTTTPWTLPSNTALAVGKNIRYVQVNTSNPYTGQQVSIIGAEALMSGILGLKVGWEEGKGAGKVGGKDIECSMVRSFTGTDIEGCRYEQLMPYVQPDGDAFRVIIGDFVTTEDGTGIVHIAPTFGADDFRVAKQNNIPALLVPFADGSMGPLVDRQGRFVAQMGDFAGKYVKNYTGEDESAADYRSTDVQISIKLKEENRAFKVEKYEHDYPHCWRTDKPILYYPLDSWFIKTTAVKDRLIELNKTINWKPASTGSGRFGNWLENLVDWNLSRSRYWGIPLPIWRTKDNHEEICIGSLEQLHDEVEKSVATGLMAQNPVGSRDAAGVFTVNPEFDMHRPFVDDILLVSDSGQPMHRETDLIDVWFDSGAMPYAQWGWPFSPPPGTPSQTLPQEGRASSTKSQTLPQEGRASSTQPGWKTTSSVYSPHLAKKARENRKQPTAEENSLWEAIRHDKVGGYHFRRQHVIDKFIADFVCLSKGLVVEVDGDYHLHPEQQASDAYRTERLNKAGFTVIRFSNKEVSTNLPAVLSTLERTLQGLPDRILDKQGEVYSVEDSPSPLGRGWGGVFPADFIAEGVDQTRGWFFTLHAISVMLFDGVAYKNVISNGLVLDKNGIKMSKRLGNIVYPMPTMAQFGADAVRWYMVGNAAPWDNLKFNEEILAKDTRSFLGTLTNTYFFFAQYANLDGFTYSGNRIPVSERRELDRWIMSKLNSLVADVDTVLEDYEPHRGIKLIEDFVEDLSNWYVRLSRRIFWKGEMTPEKEAAYQTLYECLLTLTKLMSPYAPFFSDYLYLKLDEVTGLEGNESVHLGDFPEVEEAAINKDLEQRMAFAREITSLVHSLRKNPQVNAKVRQPLQRVLVPVSNATMKQQIESVADLILAEVNVKELITVSDQDENTVFVKKAKANFKLLGQRLGRNMKAAADQIEQFDAAQIRQVERDGQIAIQIDGQSVMLRKEEIDIRTQDVPGWQVAFNEQVTVALDLTITESLRMEGIARDLVNRIQNIRKDSGLEVTDRIKVELQDLGAWTPAVKQFLDYICSETLATGLTIVSQLEHGQSIEIDGQEGKINIAKYHV